MMKILKRLIVGASFALASLPGHANENINNHFILDSESDPVVIDCALTDTDDYVLRLEYHSQSAILNYVFNYFQTIDPLTFQVMFKNARNFSIKGDGNLKTENGKVIDFQWYSIRHRSGELTGFESYYETDTDHTFQVTNVDGHWAPKDHEHWDTPGNNFEDAHGGKGIFTSDEPVSGLFKFVVANDIEIYVPSTTPEARTRFVGKVITQDFYIDCSNV